VYYNYRCYHPTNGRWLSRDLFEDSKNRVYVHTRNCPTTEYDIIGLFLIPGINKGFLLDPGSFEITIPLGSSGFDIFGNITISGEKGSNLQHISIALGSSWDMRNKLRKIAPKLFYKMIDWLPEVRLSAFLEGEFDAECGQIDFCVLTANVSLTLGNGRRGGSGKSNENIWDFFGFGLEGKFGYNFCEDKWTGDLVFFWSLNLTIGIFSYNDVFEYPLLD